MQNIRFVSCHSPAARCSLSLLLLFEGGIDLVGGGGDAELVGGPAEGEVGADGVAVQLVEGVP